MPPPLPVAAAPPIPAAVRMRELRRDPAMGPGGVSFPELVRRFLPFVYSAASALIPESQEAAQEVTEVVFETLALRWKQIPKRTFLVRFLLRTTCYLVAQQRRFLGLGKPSDLNGRIAALVFGCLNRLKPRFAEGVIAHAIMGDSIDAVANALRSNPRRVEKRVDSVIRRLTRRVRKLGKRGEPEVLLPKLDSYFLRPPAEVEEQIVSSLAAWTPKTERDPLVRKAILVVEATGVRAGASPRAGRGWRRRGDAPALRWHDGHPH